MIVVSSAVCDPFTGSPETYLFPANSQGYVLSFLELEGSRKGEYDPPAAVERLVNIYSEMRA